MSDFRPPDDLDALLRTAKRSTTFPLLDPETEGFVVETLRLMEPGNGVQLLIAARKPNGDIAFTALNADCPQALDLTLEVARRIGRKLVS